MNNSELSHSWANRTKLSAKSGNMFYAGATLFSYGRHFIVGKHCDTKKGQCVLMNSDTYSRTTAKHQNLAWRAIGHLISFRVPNIQPEELDTIVTMNYQYYLEGIKALKISLLKARSAMKTYEMQLHALIDEASFYTEFFPKGKLSLRTKIRKYNKDKNAGILISEEDKRKIAIKITKAKKLNKRHAEERKRLIAGQIAEATLQLNSWVKGGDKLSCSWEVNKELPTKLRISKGVAVETSRGAVVSLREAKVLWRAIKSKHDIIGTEIDGFKITAFNGSLTIGCHKIETAEIERIGKLIDNLEEK